MHYFLLKLITLIHFLLVVFIVVAPFTNMNYFMLLHAIIVPFIIMHWVFNDNTCALTLAEKHLKKIVYGEVDEDECITCQLINPVYDFKNNYETFSVMIYCITIALWLLSAGTLFYKYKSGSITSMADLFTF